MKTYGIKNILFIWNKKNIAYYNNGLNNGENGNKSNLE